MNAGCASDSCQYHAMSVICGRVPLCCTDSLVTEIQNLCSNCNGIGISRLATRVEDNKSCIVDVESRALIIVVETRATQVSVTRVTCTFHIKSRGNHSIPMYILVNLIAACYALFNATPFDTVKFTGNSTYLRKPFGRLSTFYPRISSIRLPLIMFYTGFGSNFPTMAYDPLLEQIAEKTQSVVVSWDGLFVSNPMDQKDQVRRADIIIKYCLEIGGLQKDLGIKIDTEQIYYSAHSSGNQIAVLMGTSHYSKALILIDPVDTDPFGLVKPIITDGHLLDYSKPVLILAAKKAHEKGASMFPPCSPAEYASGHFYDAFNTSKFLLMATDYGHHDFFEGKMAAVAHHSHFCGTVANPKLNPYSKYRDYLSGNIEMFVKAVNGRDCKQNVEMMMGKSNINSTSMFGGRLLCN